jgi:hypothetical protein
MLEKHSLYLDYRTGEWLETIPQYLLNMIAERLAGRRDYIRVLSLGWGVQSTRIAFGAALGEIDLDFAVHSDTTYETESTYAFAKKWIQWLLDAGIPVITTKDIIETSAPLKPGAVQHMPVYNINKNGKVGQLKRQCTNNWKIKPNKRAIREVMAFLGIKTRPSVVKQLLGISKDEWSRASSSKEAYIENIFPLLRQDRGAKLLPKMEARQDCITWLKDHGLQVPTKSACFHCSYKKQKQWVDMKIENGPDWKNAVAFDLAIRDKSAKYGQLFIHRSARPLAEAVRTPDELGFSQGEMFPVDDDTKCKDAGYCEFVPN